MKYKKYKLEKVVEKPRDAVATLYAARSRIKEWHSSVVEYTPEPGQQAHLVVKVKGKDTQGDCI